jgi:hypothetical protein
MDSHIKPPIIIVSDVVHTFSTIAEAEAYIEPWNAEDCTGYDAEGRLLLMHGMKEWEEERSRQRAQPTSFKERVIVKRG